MMIGVYPSQTPMSHQHQLFHHQSRNNSNFSIQHRSQSPSNFSQISSLRDGGNNGNGSWNANGNVNLGGGLSAVARERNFIGGMNIGIGAGAGVHSANGLGMLNNPNGNNVSQALVERLNVTVGSLHHSSNASNALSQSQHSPPPVYPSSVTNASSSPLRSQTPASYPRPTPSDLSLQHSLPTHPAPLPAPPPRNSVTPGPPSTASTAPSSVSSTGGGKCLLSHLGSNPVSTSESDKVCSLLINLIEGDDSDKEAALMELSKKRDVYDDLALVLWHSYGVMAALLQEIVSVYPYLIPPTLSAQASNRVCNALALLQCVASHPETRHLFLHSHIPLFLYPFLNTTSKTRPFEYLRLTSLGVIGALVKQNENSQVISFLLSTEIIPLCLRIMETGSELSKTVAIFIVQKILLDDLGLAYICQTYERFFAVGTVLSNMVTQLVESQAVRLLKHVVRCYLRLSDNARAREALRACLPEPLRDATFRPLLKGDQVTKRCLGSLLLNLSDRVE